VGWRWSDEGVVEVCASADWSECSSVRLSVFVVDYMQGWRGRQKDGGTECLLALHPLKILPSLQILYSTACSFARKLITTVLPMVVSSPKSILS
jgi:hypothetical protein